MKTGSWNISAGALGLPPAAKGVGFVYRSNNRVAISYFNKVFERQTFPSGVLCDHDTPRGMMLLHLLCFYQHIVLHGVVEILHDVFFVKILPEDNVSGIVRAIHPFTSNHFWAWDP